MKNIEFITKLIVLIFVVVTSKANAQYNLDFGAKLGTAHYLGDIGGGAGPARRFISDTELMATRWAFGGFVRYKLLPQVSVNAGILYGRISGADSLSTNPGRVARNLSFYNDIYEFYLRGEFSVLQSHDFGKRGRYKTGFNAFIFAGAALYYNNPKATINNVDWDLRPLKTEGVEYSAFGVSIPLGVGLYITKERVHRLGIDIGLRLTFTDYLDDVSTKYVSSSSLGQPRDVAIDLANRTAEVIDKTDGRFNSFQPGENRGDPVYNDTYFFVTLTYSFVLKGKTSFYKQHYSKFTKRRRTTRRKVRAKF